MTSSLSAQSLDRALLMPCPQVLPDRFEFVREGLVREYANQMHNQPYRWAA